MKWILLALAVSAVVACPKNVMQEVRQCMYPLEDYANDQGGLFMLMTGLEKTSRLCKEGKIQNAFDCLNKLYNNCAKSRHFHLLVDFGKWRAAMVNICDNIHYLQDHAECEAQANLEYQPCAEDEIEAFSQQMKEMTGSEEDKIDAIMKIGCTFTVKLQDCLRKPFEKYCPEPMTNLLVNTFENFMPPACVKLAMNGGQSQNPKYNYDDRFDERSGDDDDDDDDDDYYRNEVLVGNPHAPTNNINSNDKVNKDQPQGHGQSKGSPRAHDGRKEAIGSARSSEGDGDVSSTLSAVSWSVLVVLTIFSIIISS